MNLYYIFIESIAYHLTAVRHALLKSPKKYEHPLLAKRDVSSRRPA